MEKRKSYDGIPFPGHPRSLISDPKGFIEPLRKSTGSKKKRVRFVPDIDPSRQTAQAPIPAPSSCVDNPTETMQEQEDGSSDEDDNDIGVFEMEPDTSRPLHLQVLAKKVPREGLSLFKMGDGEWLTEYEIERRENIERNKRLTESLSIDKALSRLVSKPKKSSGTQKTGLPRLDRVSVARPPVSHDGERSNLMSGTTTISGSIAM